MIDKENMTIFDSTSGCMFNSSLATIKMQEEVNKNLEEETQYQLWKTAIEVFSEELGASWVIDGDIFYRSAFDKYLGIGVNLRDVFFEGKKLEL